MKFQCKTKPLQEALSLAIINNNVSKYYAKSVLAQLSANKDVLSVNLEASSVLSEINIRGTCSEGDSGQALIDNMLFKNLISSLDSEEITIEFEDGGIVVYSNRSKFSIPNIADVSDMSLNKPQIPEDENLSTISSNTNCWKFVKNNQMYAIAMSFSRPVYTKVWVGDDGDVLVGDIDNSIFTHSRKSNLRKTCLLSDTIINLLDSLPEDSRLIEYNGNYIVKCSTEVYDFVSQFTPQLEDENTIGSYSSEIVLSMLEVPSDSRNCGRVDVAPILKLLSQVELLSSSVDSSITVSAQAGQLKIQNESVDGVVKLEGHCPDFSLKFKSHMFKDVISHYTSDVIYIHPAKNSDEEVVGVLTWDDDMTTVLASIDEG